ncbi:MAG: hypothetical protein IJY62_06215 [Clostridia bacterium]|nr:hypothetical protein [Clostridia bacterium]
MSSTYHDDYEYEHEEKKRGGFLGKFLAVILGFLMGIIATIGSIVGLGYYIVTKVELKKAANTLGVDTATLEKYLNAEFHDLTVLGMAQEIIELSKEISSGNATFETLLAYSPAVGTAAEKIASVLAGYGADVKKDDVLKISLSSNGLSTFMMDAVKSVELGALLTKTGTEMNGLMTALCYGTEGVDYTVDSEGKISMLGDAKATTVGLLMEGDLAPVFERISLESVMALSGQVDYGNSITRSLLYGMEGETYEYDEKNTDDPITMLPLSYEVDGNTITSPDGTEFVYNSTSGKYESKNPEDGYIVAKAPSARVATSTQTDTREYDYLVYDKDGNLVYSLDSAEDGEGFNAFKDGKIQLHRPTSIGTLMSGDFQSLLSNFYLGDLLQAGEGSDEVILSLCYGERDVDWKFEDGKVIMLGDSKKTTVEALMGENSADLFNGMVIGTLLNVSPTDKAMGALAYGKEGKHYKVVEKDGKDAVEMLPIVYTLKADGFYDDNHVKVDASLVNELGENVYTITVVEGEGENETRTAYTAKPASGVDAEDGTAYYLYETTNTTPVTYKKRTLADFRGGSDELLNEIEVAAILGIDHKSDSVMIALAYGTEGVDFKFRYAEDGVTKTGIEPISDPRTIADLKSGDITSKIQLSSVLEPDKEDSVTMYLLYGVKGVHFKLDANDEVKMLGMRIAVGETAESELVAFDESGKQLAFGTDGDIKAVDGAEKNYEYTYRGETFTVVATEENKYGTDVYTLADGTQIPYYIATKNGVAYVYEPRTIADLSSEYSPVSTITEELKIGDFTKDTSSGLMSAIKDWRIADLSDQSKIKSLKIADIMSIDENDENTSLLLKTFKTDGWTIDDLSNQNKINSLKIGQIMKIDENSSGLLKQLQDKSINDLNDQATIDGIELAAVLGIDPATSGRMMLALSYGSVGTHYVLEDTDGDGQLDVKMLPMRIAIETHTDGTFSAYDERGNALTVGEGENGIIYQDGGVYVYTYLGETYTISLSDPYTENSAPVYYTYKNGDGGSVNVPYYRARNAAGELYIYESRDIADIKKEDTINALTLGDVIEIKEPTFDADGNKLSGDAHLLVSLKDTPISGLTNKINTLTLGDILEENANYGRFLSHLTESTLESLPNDLQALTLQEVYEDQVYVTAWREGDEYKTFASRQHYLNFLNDIENGGDGSAYATVNTVTAEEEANKVYYVIEKETRVHIKYNEDYAIEGQTLKVRDKYYVPNTQEVDGDLSTAEYVKPTLTGTWKYLLSKDVTDYNEDNTSHDHHASVVFDEMDCTLSEMDQLMVNMSDNIKHAALRDLDADMELELDSDFLSIVLIKSVVDAGFEKYENQTKTDPNWRKRWLFREMQLLIEDNGLTPTVIGDISIEELSLYFTELMAYYNNLIPSLPIS